MPGSVDPLSVKHEVHDEQALELTHPSYYTLAEQWEHYVQAIQTLKTGEAFLRLPDDRVIKVQTPRLPAVTVPPEGLAEVEEYYLARLFRKQHAPAPESDSAPDHPDVALWDGPAPITRRGGGA